MQKMTREGENTSLAVVSAAFEKILNNDDDSKAWACLHRNGALASAAALSYLCQSAWQLGPLHGVPIGLKDIIAILVRNNSLACSNNKNI